MAAVARRAARRLLDRWQLSVLVDAVGLVVSELMTNAVRQGAPPVRMVLSRVTDQLRSRCATPEDNRRLRMENEF